MDLACANHDFCCYEYDVYDKVSCKPQGNYCGCDCILVKDAEKGLCDSVACNAYSKGLIELFKRGTSCVSGDMQCQKRPVGDDLYNFC